MLCGAAAATLAWGAAAAVVFIIWETCWNMAIAMAAGSALLPANANVYTRSAIQYEAYWVAAFVRAAPVVLPSAGMSVPLDSDPVHPPSRLQSSTLHQRLQVLRAPCNQTNATCME